MRLCNGTFVMLKYQSYQNHDKKHMVFLKLEDQKTTILKI